MSLKKNKRGIFAYWASHNPFDAVHISSICNTYSRYSQSTALIQIFRTHGQRNSGIPEMSELIYWHIRLILAWPSCWTIIHLGMYQTNLSHFQNYPKDLGVSRGMELHDKRTLPIWQNSLVEFCWHFLKCRFYEKHPCHNVLPKRLIKMISGVSELSWHLWSWRSAKIVQVENLTFEVFVSSYVLSLFK